VKILLAVEDSKCSQAATEIVTKRMRTTDAEVRILHAAEPVWLVIDYELGQLGQNEAAREEALKHGKELLERMRPVVEAAGFRVSTELEEGDARFVIVDHADRWKADVIVMGSHGRKGLGRLLMGSVADYVSRHAHCSVVIARMPTA
jgi:nucleotide-binding universal stress UspA family protein